MQFDTFLTYNSFQNDFSKKKKELRLSHIHARIRATFLGWLPPAAPEGATLRGREGRTDASARHLHLRRHAARGSGDHRQTRREGYFIDNSRNLLIDRREIVEIEHQKLASTDWIYKKNVLYFPGMLSPLKAYENNYICRTDPKVIIFSIRWTIILVSASAPFTSIYI